MLTTQQKQKLEKLLDSVQKPATYLGGEMNQRYKPEASFGFAFCFPDTYDVGMSHLGMKILYDILNNLEDIRCERVFMPGVDMADGLKKEGIPLFSLETRTPLKDFPLIGFTLQYEMSFTCILEMLDLGGVKVLAKERAENGPIVLAGGPCASNPEPLTPFIDAFMLGDGEESIVEVTEIVKTLREKGETRENILFALSQIEGVYVPRFYTVTYNEDGTIQNFAPNKEGVPAVVKRRIHLDFENAPYPEKMIVPYTQIVHDRVVLEVMRGCSRGCRFCQAGYIYRPVRERSPERVMGLADCLISSSGYEELSITSLSTGDYTGLSELVPGLNELFKNRQVALSLPSLRVDGKLKETLEETGQVKKGGLTFAAEAGTQRLRDVINKGVTEDDLLTAVSDAFSSGYAGIKLYFMTSLPTETEEDLEGIARLAGLIRQKYFEVPKESRPGGLRITISTSTFVPKPFTPFQWFPQDAPEAINQKQKFLRENLRIKGVVFRWNDWQQSQMEAAIARGDRRMGEVIYEAWKLGCRLDSWSEHFKYDLWLEAFQKVGATIEFYANRERNYEEILPWDFIDMGVTKDFLRLENERAKKGIVTPDCRQGCRGCGLQRFEGVCQ
jgi:radical SAM family uncharacterized protein